MVIKDAQIEECASCDRRFDLNFAERMQQRQRDHAQRQLHLFGSCAFLLRSYEPRWLAAELYDTPWEKEGRLVYFHNDKCEQAYCSPGFGSFQYVWCQGCDRQICEQNPANGWHVQFRNHADLGYICLRCYETEILENGQPREDFEGHSIRGGMFFSGDNREPLRAGFEPIDDLTDYFVPNHEAAKRYNAMARSLIDSGQKVVTGYERLAIGGLEGYITMFAKSESPKSLRH